MQTKRWCRFREKKMDSSKKISIRDFVDYVMQAERFAVAHVVKQFQWKSVSIKENHKIHFLSLLYAYKIQSHGVKLLLIQSWSLN